MRLLLTLALVSILLISCRKDKDLSTDPSLQLAFSQDSLFFDTTFTSQGSAFQYLWVYNRHNSALQYETIRLANGNASDFDLLINGQYVNSTSNVYIPANDSMLFLVRANINPQNLNAPFLTEDFIEFVREGTTQQFPLIAYGRDVTYRTNYTCACSEIWTSGKPYIIVGKTTVSAGCTLQVNAGTAVYFHAGASMEVLGTLLSNGTFANPVVMHSDRLEDDQKKAPGSWSGIVIANQSSGNQFYWTEISGGTNLIQAQTDLDADTIPEIQFSNCVLSNASETLLDLGDADFYGYNVLMHTSIGALINANGGTVYLDHATLANLNGFARTAPNLVLGVGGKYRIKNSLVWGNKSNEFSVAGADFVADYSLLKGSGINGVSQVLNQDPLFEAYYEDNFRLKDGSPAINTGVLVSGQTEDLDTKTRDAQPDLGAYEK